MGALCWLLARPVPKAFVFDNLETRHNCVLSGAEVVKLTTKISVSFH